MSFNSSNDTNITAPSPYTNITEPNATNITAPSPYTNITEPNATNITAPSPYTNITAPSPALAPSPIPVFSPVPSPVFSPVPSPVPVFGPSPVPAPDSLLDRGLIIPQIAAVLFVCMLIVATVFRKKIQEMAKIAREKYMSHSYVSIDHLPDNLPEIDVTAEIEMVPEIDVEISKQEHEV